MNLADLFRRHLGRAGSSRRAAPAAHMPLERLPLVAIDCETTGLNPRRDRIVSFAAVPIHAGLRVADEPLIDLLVDPEIPIPARATAVHGIDRTRLAGAATFAGVYDRIADGLAGRVVVGHYVGFDLAILAREAARARKRWREPPSLDTASLATSLGYHADTIDLEALLARLGIEAKGRRHTAAGDARMAADLFVALAHRLAGLGRGTFGGAVAGQRPAGV